MERFCVYICCHDDGTFGFFRFEKGVEMYFGDLEEVKDIVKKYRNHIKSVEYIGLDPAHIKEFEKILKNSHS